MVRKYIYRFICLDFYCLFSFNDGDCGRVWYANIYGGLFTMIVRL